jgi:predicted RNA-binding Zn-ribbon protein involved in translation (DUF1610 family)
MINLDKEEYLEMRNDYMGICLACKDQACEIEPDAREYKCENCGEKKVYGIEELLLMGEIEINE